MIFTKYVNWKALSTLGVNGHRAVRNALRQDEIYVSFLMREVLSSPEKFFFVKSLDPQGAEKFMVLLQDVSSIRAVCELRVYQRSVDGQKLVVDA